MHRVSRRTIATAGAVAGALALATPLAAPVAGAARPQVGRHVVKPTIEVRAVKAYGHVLATAAGRSLYLFGPEAGGKIKCSGACLAIWPPLLVPASTKHLSVGPGVKGKIGFVHRTATKNQVTFNGYPVYVYSGDAKAGQTNGEGLVHGGTWYLVNPAATTPKATPVKQKATTTAARKSSGGW